MRSGCEVSLYSCARNSAMPVQLRQDNIRTVYLFSYDIDVIVKQVEIVSIDP
jgi:hypothetical protein